MYDISRLSSELGCGCVTSALPLLFFLMLRDSKLFSSVAAVAVTANCAPKFYSSFSKLHKFEWHELDYRMASRACSHEVHLAFALAVRGAFRLNVRTYTRCIPQPSRRVDVPTSTPIATSFNAHDSEACAFHHTHAPIPSAQSPPYAQPPVSEQFNVHPPLHANMALSSLGGFALACILLSIACRAAGNAQMGKVVVEFDAKPNAGARHAEARMPRVCSSNPTAAHASSSLLALVKLLTTTPYTPLPPSIPPPHPLTCLLPSFPFPAGKRQGRYRLQL